MKTNKHLLRLPVAVGLLSALILSGCMTQIDMNEVDTTAQASMGVALPVGTVNVTLGDMLGLTPIADKICYDSTGTIVFQTTFNIRKAYHPVDISQRGTSPEQKHLHMMDYLPSGDQTFNGSTASMTFDVGMKLNNINDNLSNERVDSVLVEKAEFTSMLNYRPAYGSSSMIKEEWIDRIELILGDQFSREQGKAITLYDNQHPESYPSLVYNQQFKVEIDEFSMTLMKERNIPTDSASRNHNAIDSIHFQIRLQLTIPNGETVKIDSNSAFEYEMQLGMLKYRAIWGFFSPSKDMHDRGSVRIDELWEGWKTMNGLRIPFSDPEITLECVTQTAGQWRLKGDYVYAKEDATGEIRYATFDGHHNLDKVFPAEECLSLDSEIGDSTTLHLHFSKDPSEGTINKLFELHPDELGYDFNIDFADYVNNPIARITENTDIAIHGLLKLPMSFNENLNVTYSDTIADLDLQKINKDSLMKSLSWLDSLGESTARLVLIGKNCLPMAVDGRFKFLDEFGMPLKVLSNDSVHFAAPTLAADGSVEKPGEIDLVVEMTDEQLEVMSKVKNIIYEVNLNDKDVRALKEQNPSGHYYPLQLKNTSSLKIKIGLAASVEGVFDIKSMFNQE